GRQPCGPRRGHRGNRPAYRRRQGWRHARLQPARRAARHGRGCHARQAFRTRRLCSDGLRRLPRHRRALPPPPLVHVALRRGARRLYGRSRPRPARGRSELCHDRRGRLGRPPMGPAPLGLLRRPSLLVRGSL
ncbi:MAG: Sporulation protein YlmC, partial [uncultured Craurococcus sp.]